MAKLMNDDILIKSTSKTMKILYIEDEPAISQSVSKILSYFSDYVTTFSNAEEAMENYKNIQPDIVISDINLPGMSGIELVKWIRTFDETTQVFLLTAYTDKEYLLEAVKLKLVDYLTKPINFDKLNLTLKQAAMNLIKAKPMKLTLESGAIYCFQEKSIVFEDEKHILTSKEVKFVDYLILNKHRVTSKEELLSNLWDDDMGTESAFKGLVNKLRAKIGKCSIENISGLGYKILIKQ